MSKSRRKRLKKGTIIGWNGSEGRVLQDLGETIKVIVEDDCDREVEEWFWKWDGVECVIIREPEDEAEENEEEYKADLRYQLGFDPFDWEFFFESVDKARQWYNMHKANRESMPE
jgi:hypothetical protein